MEDLEQIDNSPITIYEDNRGCVGMSTNLECKRAKHIDIKHHFIRDFVERSVIKIESISTEKQLADLFTKSLDGKRLQNLSLALGLKN